MISTASVERTKPPSVRAGGELVIGTQISQFAPSGPLDWAPLNSPLILVWTPSLGHFLLQLHMIYFGVQGEVSPSCEFYLRGFPNPFVQVEDLCEFCANCSITKMILYLLLHSITQADI